jgi:hypothetical protein
MRGRYCVDDGIHNVVGFRPILARLCPIDPAFFYLLRDLFAGFFLSTWVSHRENLSQRPSLSMQPWYCILFGIETL